MHSVHVSKPNGPFELVEQKHIPEPNATQIRIKVQACGVCYSDTMMKQM
jgi:D-arabinose 1-dehydrogenase-like Zn-dependent alcohol dehydrogenase